MIETQSLPDYQSQDYQSQPPPNYTTIKWKNIKWKNIIWFIVFMFHIGTLIYGSYIISNRFNYNKCEDEDSHKDLSNHNAKFDFYTEILIFGINIIIYSIATLIACILFFKFIVEDEYDEYELVFCSLLVLFPGFVLFCFFILSSICFLQTFKYQFIIIEILFSLLFSSFLAVLIGLIIYLFCMALKIFFCHLLFIFKYFYCFK